jgi:hypothetical protein
VVQGVRTDAYRFVWCSVYERSPGDTFTVSELQLEVKQPNGLPLSKQTVKRALDVARLAGLCSGAPGYSPSGALAVVWKRLAWPEPVTLDYLVKQGLSPRRASLLLFALVSGKFLSGEFRPLDK